MFTFSLCLLLAIVVVSVVEFLVIVGVWRPRWLLRQIKTTARLAREGEVKEVQAAYVVYETDKIVFAQINTASKRPRVTMYAGGSGVCFEGGERIVFDNLPFSPSTIFAASDRHTLYVWIFNDDLLEGLSFRNEGKTVFERDEQLSEPAPTKFVLKDARLRAIVDDLDDTSGFLIKESTLRWVIEREVHEMLWERPSVPTNHALECLHSPYDVHIGKDDDPTTCRYCGKQEPEVVLAQKR